MRMLKIFAPVLLCLLSNTSYAYCFEEAGEAYRIDPALLKAIAIHESKLKASTVVRNTNDTLDVGLMGINTVHLKDPYLMRAGFRSPQDLLEPCTNVKLGAWLLSRKIQKWGQSWQAVGAYHSETPDRNLVYQRLIGATFFRVKKSIADGQ
jgi:lysozyme-related protein Hpa2